MRLKSRYHVGEFPKVFRSKKRGNFAVWGIGGNIGNVPRRFKKLLQLLKAHRRIGLHASSIILKNPPFGYLEQPDFFNAVIAFDTDMSPRELLRYGLYLERRFKRRRTFKNAPRTLDIDIIFYEDRVMKKRDLQIPHPHWSERASVIIPLRFILEVS